MHKVTLISYTTPAPELKMNGILTTEDIVSFCARVSNPTGQLNTDTSEKLLKYLIKNAHWSPFEMVDLTFEIETTRDIARQILRHRSFSFQEFSQRYADPSQLGFTIREARLQDNKNRQNSIETDDDTLKNEWEQIQKEFYNDGLRYYKWALDQGIAKEVARCVLPEGMTVSRMYMKGSLRSWIHYLQLRRGNGTQLEHRLIADDIAMIIASVTPALVEQLAAKELQK